MTPPVQKHRVHVTALETNAVKYKCVYVIKCNLSQYIDIKCDRGDDD